jgi:hypothetical protein
MASTDLHFHITWDSEPTEQAKAFVKKAVLEALAQAVTDTAWLKELVQEEIRKTPQAEQAKAFTKLAVVEVLNEMITDTAWFMELVRAEVCRWHAMSIHVDGRKLTEALEPHLRDRGKTT